MRGRGTNVHRRLIEGECGRGVILQSFFNFFFFWGGQVEGIALSLWRVLLGRDGLSASPSEA